MESHAKLFGHPIHPMLIVLPMGLLAAAVVFDILYLFVDDDTFLAVSFWNIAAGIVGGLLAAIFGLWDWLHIPSDTRAKRIGLMHGGGNVVVLALFAGSWLLRLNEPGYETSGLALGLAVAGMLLALVTGWLGGELVDRLGVGVDDGANLDAPNSLSGRPASDSAGVGGRAPATRR
ncbi:MAG TPA: DUF2231 domain-containing protein [Candidatus Limnocylindria bacterium]|nr:DUF2231 domain-containing protein [Candidatus Limnocylindria bacterium]